MSIVRAARPESGWYALDRRISEDERLSWAARGLLVFLLGKPDNWQVSVEHLRKQTDGARVRTGRDGVYALLGELRDAGYVQVTQQRLPDGTLRPVEYMVREAPPLTAQPDTAEPDTAQPLPAQPYTAQPTLDKTDTSVKTDGETRRKRASAPVVDLPAWLSPEAWAAFVDHRRKIKSPLTDRAAELAVRELEKLRAEGHDPAKVIDQSVMNGWRGLFKLKSQVTHGTDSSVGVRRESAIERIERINREHDRREGLR